MALPFRTKIGYGIGHVLNDLCSAMWFTYLLIFFHHVLVFNNTLAGVVLLIGQIADGLATPFVGYQADRLDDTTFCSKYGRKKTWHLVGSLCVACAFPFVFLGCIGCNSSSDWAQVIYFAPFVTIFQFGWASTQISHLSLIPTLTQDQNERTELNAIRNGFTVMSNISVYVVTWMVLGLSGSGDNSIVGPEDKTKFMGIVFIVVGLGLVFSITFHILVKESNENPYENFITESGCCRRKTKMEWSCWLKEPQFYQVALLYMATRVFCNLTQAYVPIYLQDTLHLNEESVAYIPLLMYVSGFIITTIMKPINKLIGRKATFAIGSLVGFGGCLWTWFGTDELYTKYLLYVVSALIGMAGSTMLVTSLTITADLIGPNSESGAFVYGAMSFTDKVSNGLAVMAIQTLNPCPGCCHKCELYFRAVLAFGCGGAALLGLVAILTLIPTTIGKRRKAKEIDGSSDESAPRSSVNIMADDVSSLDVPDGRLISATNEDVDTDFEPTFGEVEVTNPQIHQTLIEKST